MSAPPLAPQGNIGQTRPTDDKIMWLTHVETTHVSDLSQSVSRMHSLPTLLGMPVHLLVSG